MHFMHLVYMHAWLHKLTIGLTAELILSSGNAFSVHFSSSSTKVSHPHATAFWTLSWPAQSTASTDK
eukprot:1161688-Pelagomonas_calceolata.AAC.3